MPAKRTKRPLDEANALTGEDSATRKPQRAQGERTSTRSSSGSALVATGLFLARVLYLGWDGGVGGHGARPRRTHGRRRRRLRAPAGARQRSAG